MRLIVLVCMILSREFVCQGQQNLDNNRLTKKNSDDEKREFGVVDAPQEPTFTRSTVTLSRAWPMDAPKKEQVDDTREDSNRWNLFEKTRQGRNFQQRSPVVDYPHSVLSSESSIANQASGEALNEFMNSQTSEESRIALDNYLNALEPNDGKNNADNHMISNHRRYYQNIPSGLLNGVSSSKNGPHNSLPIDYYYALGQQKQPVRYRGHRHRVPMNNGLGVRPWLASQSRIASRPLALYRDKGFPLAQSANAADAYRRHYAEKWDSHPVGTRVIHRPFRNNLPVLYQDPNNNNHRIHNPVDSETPPQNDVYYSQLYAQSYDPHYYNYIAKTGKIKPWLYGKLGKHEGTSIWWELFNNFKKHGMKNMMNPIFLLGMTIPTLTIILSALVQKRRSFGRDNNSDSYYNSNEKLIDEYTEKLERAIECYEKLIENDKDNDYNDCW